MPAVPLRHQSNPLPPLPRTAVRAPPPAALMQLRSNQSSLAKPAKLPRPQQAPRASGALPALPISGKAQQLIQRSASNSGTPTDYNFRPFVAPRPQVPPPRAVPAAPPELPRSDSPPPSAASSMPGVRVPGLRPQGGGQNTLAAPRPQSFVPPRPQIPPPRAVPAASPELLRSDSPPPSSASSMQGVRVSGLRPQRGGQSSSATQAPHIVPQKRTHGSLAALDLPNSSPSIPALSSSILAPPAVMGMGTQQPELAQGTASESGSPRGVRPRLSPPGMPPSPVSIGIDAMPPPPPAAAASSSSSTAFGGSAAQLPASQGTDRAALLGRLGGFSNLRIALSGFGAKKAWVQQLQPNWPDANDTYRTALARSYSIALRAEEHFIATKNAGGFPSEKAEKAAAAHVVGDWHEVVETARLQKIGYPINGSQESIVVPIDGQYLMPREWEHNGATREFRPDLRQASDDDVPRYTEIKTGQDMSASRDQLVAMAIHGHVDIAMASSSRVVDMKTLATVGEVAVAHNHQMRVRSNSMAEGRFVELRDLADRREQIHTLADMAPRPSSLE